MAAGLFCFHTPMGSDPLPDHHHLAGRQAFQLDKIDSCRELRSLISLCGIKNFSTHNIKHAELILRMITRYNMNSSVYGKN